jgi:hypothetical protein
MWHTPFIGTDRLKRIHGLKELSSLEIRFNGVLIASEWDSTFAKHGPTMFCTGIDDETKWGQWEVRMLNKRGDFGFSLVLIMIGMDQDEVDHMVTRHGRKIKIAGHPRAFVIELPSFSEGGPGPWG